MQSLNGTNQYLQVLTFHPRTSIYQLPVAFAVLLIAHHFLFLWIFKHCKFFLWKEGKRYVREACGLFTTLLVYSFFWFHFNLTDETATCHFYFERFAEEVELLLYLIQYYIQPIPVIITTKKVYTCNSCTAFSHFKFLVCFFSCQGTPVLSLSYSPFEHANIQYDNDDYQKDSSPYNKTSYYWPVCCCLGQNELEEKENVSVLWQEKCSNIVILEKNVRQ